MDPDQARATVQGSFEFLSGMNLDQRIHAQLILSKSAQPNQSFVIQHCDDQQQRIRARRGCLVNLVFVKNKILAQNGEPDRTSNRAQVVKRAIEIIFFSQN